MNDDDWRAERVGSAIAGHNPTVLADFFALVESLRSFPVPAHAELMNLVQAQQL